MPTGPRAWINSIWMIAATTVVTVAVAGLTLTSDTPPGIEIVRDPARTATLHAGFDGSYGQAAATVLVLDHGRLTGHVGGAPAGSNAFDVKYRYGERGGQVVIVVNNGAVLEPQPDKSLVFLESRYPKLVAR
jgi:hypothetical protein